MKSLPQRVLSAAALLIVLFATIQLGGRNGLIALSGVILIAATNEFYRLMLKPVVVNKSVRTCFLLASIIWGLVVFHMPQVGFAWLAVIFGFYTFLIMWLLGSQNLSIDIIFQAIARSALGFFYCVTLPIFALHLLSLNGGFHWFIYLLSVVFVGDVAAYFGGLLWGKKKLMPSLSPSKTIVGAFAGVFGSSITAMMLALFHPDLGSATILALLGVPTAILAQSGDFFESLLKRVAGVKDSGRILPGHGGILDRLDGIYFAAPFVYAAATYLAHTF